MPSTHKLTLLVRRDEPWPLARLLHRRAPRDSLQSQAVAPRTQGPTTQAPGDMTRPVETASTPTPGPPFAHTRADEQHANECLPVTPTSRRLLLEALVIEADAHLSTRLATLAKHKPDKSLLLSVRTTMQLPVDQR